MIMEPTFNRDELECPYCHKMQRDLAELEGNEGYFDCAYCLRVFKWSRDYHVTYTGTPIYSPIHHHDEP